MAYSKLSTSISDYLVRELKYEDEKKDIIAYSLDSMFLTVIGFILIMLVGWVLSAPKATFFAVLAGGMLRKVSGGAHFNSPFLCLLTGAIIYPLLGWGSTLLYLRWEAAPYSDIVLVLICIACLIAVVFLAPVDSEAKPIVSLQFRRKLKFLSILTVLFFSASIFTFIDSILGISMTGGLLFQSITLLPMLNKR